MFTVLAMLTRDEPEIIRPRINTKNPVIWSDCLLGHGMKLPRRGYNGGLKATQNSLHLGDYD